MPNKTLSITMVEQIFRLYKEGISKSEIASRLGISRNTVKSYLRSKEEIATSDILSEEKLNCAFEFDQTTQIYSNPSDLEEVFNQMDINLKRTGFTRRNIWNDYKKANPEGYSYSQFCFHYQQHCKKTGASMHIIHKCGDKMFVDYAGKKLSIIDKETGEIQECETFISTLGFSGFTYVEASKSQKKADFLQSIENALYYYDGVPSAIVPDNLKSAVDKTCKYEPKINETLEDFALHYNTVILPARSRKPKDKALVENAVCNIYRSIYYALHNKEFFSIEELNQAIREELSKYNHKLYQGRDYSRHNMYEQEKPYLKKLPKYKYEIKTFCNLKVHKISHIYLSADKHYYSVPYQFIGQQVKVVYNNRHVEIYKDNQRIAFHLRNRKPNEYTSESDHLPSTHRFMSDLNPQLFIEWGYRVGKSTADLIIKILQSRSHPEESYRSCMGLQSLARKMGNERLEKAACIALNYDVCTYTKVKTILMKNLDQTILITPELQYNIPFHENIRGSNYYQ